MKKLSITLLALLANAICVPGASAVVYDLYQSAKYQDATVVTQPTLPLANIPSSNAILSLSFVGAGPHTARAFVDAEIDQVANTFWNEYGATAPFGPSAGQSWEIDEPGYVFGDIWTNFNDILAGLDNTNGVPIAFPDDVAMALGWDFTLGDTETATVKFFVTDVAPTGAFYLTQTDVASVIPGTQLPATLYFYSTIEYGTTCTGDACNRVPEPSTLWLLGPALAGLLWSRRKFSKAP